MVLHVEMVLTKIDIYPEERTRMLNGDCIGKGLGSLLLSLCYKK